MKPVQLKDIHFSPWTNQLIDAAGMDAAMKMSLELGGSRQQIPQKIHGSIIEEAIGTKAAEKIVGAFSGAVITIPLNNTALIVWLRDKGWDQQTISCRLRVCRRTVQRTLSGKSGKFPDLSDYAYTTEV